MPRAFDRGVPAVDKNPLISATTWGDPSSVIGEAATGAGGRIQSFIFGLFAECGEFVSGLSEFGTQFLTDLLDTLGVELANALEALEPDEQIIVGLQEQIERIRTQLASPNPLVLIGAGLQAYIDSIWRLFNCPDPETILEALTPEDLASTLEDIVGDLTANPFVKGLVALAEFLGESVNNFIRDAIIGGGRLIEILCGILTCKPTAAATAAGIANHNSGIAGTTPFSLIAGILEVLTPIVNSPFVQGLVAVAQWLGRATGNFARDVFEGAIGIADWVCGILTCQPLTTGPWPNIPAGVTTPLSLLKGFADRIAPVIANPFVQGVIAYAEDVGVAVDDFFLDLFNGALAFVEGLCSLITTGALPQVFGNWSNTPAQIIGDVLGLVNQLLNNPITNGLRDLITGDGNLLYDTIGGALEFITQLGDLLGIVISGPQAILDFFTGELGVDGLLGWINTIPFLGPLVSKLTGFDSSGDIALDLTNLGNWAAGLLTNASAIPAANLIGSIPQALLSIVPVSAINLVGANLLAQGNFNVVETVEPAGGWSWDADTTATGTGGSLKAVGTGALQQIYSRQTVKVASGDRLVISAKVKTSGFTAAAGRSMVLAIIPWVGTTAQTAHVVHTRTTAATTFQNMTGSTVRIGGTAGSGEIALASNITAITVRLAVTANTGALVWFDDVSVSKTGSLQQVLVDSLIEAWNEIWRGLTNPLLPIVTGKTWEDLFGAASGFRSVFNTEQDRGDTLRLNIFGSPTTVGTQANLGFIPDIPRTKSPDMQLIINGLWRGLFSPDTANRTAEDVYSAAYATADNVAKLKASVAKLESDAANGSYSGNTASVDFASYSAASSLPSPPWTSTRAGTGAGRVGIANDRAAWLGASTDVNRTDTLIYTQTASNTNYQRIGVTVATMANTSLTNDLATYIYGRSNSTGTTAVYAKLMPTKCELWAVTGGTATRLDVVEGTSGSGFLGFNFFLAPGNYWLECGVGTTERRFRIWQDNKVIIDKTDTTNISPLGNKFTGFGSQATTYQQSGTKQGLPPELAAFAFYDNTQATTLGSGFRAIKTSGSNSVTATHGAGATPVVAELPGSFFNTEDAKTDDLTHDTTTNKITASVAGWYLVTVSLKASADIINGSLSTALYKNGSVFSIGHTQFGLATGGGDVAAGTFIVYLNKNDYVQPGYSANRSHTLIGTTNGSAAWSVAFLSNTKPVNA